MKYLLPVSATDYSIVASVDAQTKSASIRQTQATSHDPCKVFIMFMNLYRDQLQDIGKSFLSANSAIGNLYGKK
jgi:hypothetical protein